jgi:hypothetical protein
MDKKEKFQVVKQVEIDGELYHEAAEVAFGVVKSVNDSTGVKSYTLKKYILIRDKVVKETKLRTEEGLSGRETVRIQGELELKRYLKKRDEE